MFGKRLDLRQYDKPLSDEKELWAEFDTEASEYIREKKKEAREKAKRTPHRKDKVIRKRKYKGQSLFGDLWKEGL